jgi:hypothetical protein
MRPFKPFWGWIKNTSSSPAQGFFSPLLCLKFFPSYLLPPPSYLPPSSFFPHLTSSSLHLQSSKELSSLSSTELWGDIDTRLEEGGELNVERMWREKSKRSVSSQMQKQKKKGKLPPFSTLFFFSGFFFFVCLFFFSFLCVCFFFFVWKEVSSFPSLHFFSFSMVFFFFVFFFFLLFEKRKMPR